METDSQYTRDQYFEILGSEEPLALDDARILLIEIEQACSEDPIEAASDRWYFYGRIKNIAKSHLDSSEDPDQEAWEVIFQLASRKLEGIQKQPLTNELVDELLDNRMWRWKPVDALLLAHSLPARFHHAGNRAKIHYVILQVAWTCRDKAQGALRENWELAIRCLLGEKGT